jgi:hypothetical protein
MIRVMGDAQRSAVVTWTEVDGVSVVHGHEPGPLRGSLAFRIGKTDEYLHANGITHLAEHLALHALGQPPHYQNGSVRTCITTFDTVGDDEQVISFFSGTCEALVRLDAERLEAERRILQVEAQQRGFGLSSQLFSWRYGAGGPGLWGFEEYAVLGASAEAIQTWADYVFRAQNAVLVLSGPPPAGLRLPLPPGVRIPVPELSPMLPHTPARFSTGRPQVGGLATLSRSVSATAYADLLGRRLVDRLRRELAVSYAPWVEYDRYDAAQAHLLVTADVHPDHLAAATAALVGVVEEMAEEGVTEQELAGLRVERHTSLAVADTAACALVEAFTWLLSGERTPWDAFEAEADALVPDDLLAPAREARDGMLYAVPQGVSLDMDRIVEAPSTSLEPELHGSSLTPSMAAPSGATMSVSDDGVERTWPDGTRSTVRYRTCRAVLAYPSGARVLIGPDATAVAIEPSEWIEARTVISAVDAATAGVVVPMPEPVEADASTVQAPAAAVSPTPQWSLLFLAVVCLVGGAAAALMATSPAAKDARGGLFGLSMVSIWSAIWLFRRSGVMRR